MSIFIPMERFHLAMAPPNVLLITIDSLRADHTSCLKYDRNVDPRLSELGQEGALFRQAVANGPNTTASFPSILSGSHSLTYGPYGICGEGSPFLSKSQQEAGYQTVGHHSNPYLGKEQRYPTGFSVFNDAVEGNDTAATLKDRVERMVPSDSYLYRILRRGWHHFSVTTDNLAYARAKTISENALEWFEQEWGADPFFMWLHYMDVHYPFQPPDEAFDGLPFNPLSNRRSVKLNGKMQENPEKLTNSEVSDLLKLYDAEIRYTDSQIGRVLDYLKERGIMENTLVVITADHGEAFGEHGRFGHHPYPFDELIRVPLIIVGPGVQSVEVTQQVSLLDLAPTVLELVGAEIPKAMEGESFAKVLTGDEINNRTAMTISENGAIFGCRNEQWKFITRWEGNEEYLFNLEDDPQESRNVANDYPEVVNEFESNISEYLSKIGDEMDHHDLQTAPGVRQRLKDLGYVDE